MIFMKLLLKQYNTSTSDLPTASHIFYLIPRGITRVNISDFDHLLISVHVNL